VIVTTRNHFETGTALQTHALKVALEHDDSSAALRAGYNLADLLSNRDAYEESLQRYEEVLALARKVGTRRHEVLALLDSTYPLLLLGRWDEAVARVAEVSESELEGPGALMLVGSMPELEVARGRIERAEWTLALVQDRAGYAAAKATVLRAAGRHAEALAAAEEAIAMVDILGWGSQVAKQGFVEAIEAALALGELERAATLVALIEDRPRGAAPLYLRAHAARFRARLSTGNEVEPRLKSAAATFRELGLPFWTAVAELELAEWLVAHGRDHEAAPLLAGARETFERLEATPWVERADLAGAGREPDVVAAGS
jgi:tetratricopeptide (TPR) repeat protein